nr:glycosyltransferase [Devriesea agamarum]
MVRFGQQEGLPAPRVVAVVVSYNREQLLRECLDALAAQTRPVDAVVVVDNASTDGSGQVADNHRVVTEVVHLTRNVGGAGGFAAGIARAMLAHRPDWVWIMDDDTIARPEALEALLRAASGPQEQPAVLSSTAVWTDGREHPMNTSRQRLGANDDELAAAQDAGCRAIRTASFVSAMIDARHIAHAGLPEADYFIWSDDFEYTGRILRKGRGLRVPDSIVEHRTRAFDSARSDPGDRFYYEVRNKIWALLRSGSFSWWEAVLYGGRTALSWGGVIVRTRGKRLGAGLRGLRHAVGSKPRPSAAVLASDPASAADIRAMEAVRRP